MSPRRTPAPLLTVLAVAAAVATLVAACGGSAPDDTATAFVQRIDSDGGSAPRRVLATAEAAPQAAAVALPNAKELFDWAEYKFPELFYPAQTFANYTLSYAGQTYTVRSYANGNNLGLTPDGRIFGLGPFTENVLTAFGTAADYAAQVAADKCRVSPSSCFVTGASHAVNVSANAGGEVTDSASGVRLLLPDGGSGQITMTRLTATVPAPVAGTGWQLTYNSAQRMEIVLDGAFDGTGAWPAVYVFDAPPAGAVDDDRGLEPRWLPLPMRQVAPGRYAFEVAPGVSPAAAERPHALATGSSVTRNYYIAQSAKATTDTEKRLAQYSLGHVYIDDFIGTLSTSRAAAVRSRIATKLPSWGQDSNFYRGFSYFVTRRLYPQINVTLDNQSLAHELGHYLTHMMVGDDVYERLEKQPYAKKHGILDVNGRGSINEDYAFFIEAGLIGTGGRYNLDQAASFLRSRKAGADVPSIEGFTAAMLAAMVRTTTLIPSIDNKDHMVDVPVVGLTRDKIYDVVAAGPTDVDALRRGIEGVLDVAGQDRMRVNLQRLGWRYSATLRVVDSEGQPVVNAAARLLVRSGSSEYVADVGQTDAQGALNLWFAFPGASTLEIVRAGETLEGLVNIDPARPTSDRVALGDIKVTGRETFVRLVEVCASFSYTTITAQSRIEAGPFNRVQCVDTSATPLTWGGTLFTTVKGQTSAEGWYSQARNMVYGLKARQPHSGSYKTPPPLFAIYADGMQRDLTSSVVRFRLNAGTVGGHYTINYQPEDDCLGGYCEARAIKAIDPASVSIWATFRDY